MTLIYIKIRVPELLKIKDTELLKRALYKVVPILYIFGSTYGYIIKIIIDYYEYYIYLSILQ